MDETVPEDGIYWVTNAPGFNWIATGYVAIAELSGGVWSFMGSDEFILRTQAMVVAGPVTKPEGWK